MSTSGVSGSSNSSGIIGTQTISTSGGLTSGSTLTNNGAGGQLQLTGLASGINTNELIQAELAEKELPLTNLQDSITAMQHREHSSWARFRARCRRRPFDALDLGLPSLFFNSQTVTSSDTSLVSATTTQNIGAVIGSTTLSVARLASASQATFGYTAPASATDTLTIGNDQGSQTVAVTAGESNAQVANDINGANNGVAYATVLSNGQLVISSRATGDGSSDGYRQRQPDHALIGSVRFTHPGRLNCRPGRRGVCQRQHHSELLRHRHDDRCGAGRHPDTQRGNADQCARDDHDGRTGTEHDLDHLCGPAVRGRLQQRHSGDPERHQHRSRQRDQLAPRRARTRARCSAIRSWRTC